MDTSTSLSEHYIRRNLRFLAPEVAEFGNTSDVGDIYSFGVMAYELITGTTIDAEPNSPDEVDVDILVDIQRHLTIEPVAPIDYLSQTSRTRMPRPLSDIIMKCLAKDCEERYASLGALVYDIRVLGRLCRENRPLGQFKVGEVDRVSRFGLPDGLVQRESQFAQLEEVFGKVVPENTSKEDPSGTRLQVVNIWALSGYGKTRLVYEWLGRNRRQCLTGKAKMDEHNRLPMSSFIQVFKSLIDRVLTDIKESPKDWRQKIRDTLGSQYPILLSIMPLDTRRLLDEDGQETKVESFDVRV